MEMSTELTLLVAAFLSATLSGALGMGGGTLLIGVMAQYFPLEILVPLHGIIQLASNSSRALYSLRHCDRRMTLKYAVGAIVGAALGSRVVVQVPEHAYPLGLGAFILLITFVPLPRSRARYAAKWPLVGGFSTFLSLFVGATGPLIAPFYLSEELKREALIATKAACQTFTHLLKVVTFFALGFVIGPYLPILIGMLAMVLLGTYAGKLLLNRISERWFALLFRALIVLLAARMIARGLS
jgi:uncharacterized membrane protein YfcA